MIELKSISIYIIVALIFVLYWIIVFTLDKHGILRKYNISAYFGLLLVIRTMRGQKFLDKLATPKGFWRIFANFGVPLMLISMFSMFLIFIYIVYLIIVYSPSHLSQESLGETIRMSLFIPGINPFLPFVWGWIALIVTLIVHEFAHAILCKVEGIRVKSMGILYAIIPLGGFAEPDEEQLFGVENTNKKVATRKEKIRILTAGVMANFVVAFIALALFFGPVLGAIAPIDQDVRVMIAPDIEQSGIYEKMVVTQINDTKIKNVSDFFGYMDSTESGANVRIYATNYQEDKVYEVKVIKGIVINQVVKGSPAEDIGLKKGMILTKINNISLTNISDFINFMNSTQAGDEVKVQVLSNNSINATLMIFKVKLTKHPLENINKGFLGVSYDRESAHLRLTGIEFGVFSAKEYLQEQRAIPYMLNKLKGWFYMFILAIEYPGFSGMLLHFYEPTGWATYLGNGIFILANLLLWIGWVNFYVGVFNCLPAIPLDGGHVFRDLVKSNSITLVFSIAIWSSLIFMILGPYIIPKIM
ncbi:MAG: site-2 protease family protein [Methanosarcinales archaeon]